jgi:UDP-glucose 4-epimerase
MSNCILITGAAGFLGTYLAEECSRHGCRLIGIDRHNPKRKELWTRFEIGEISENLLRSAIGNESIDACFHLAGSTAVSASVNEPFRDFMSLMPASALLLAHCARHNPSCHLILFSSAAVYGNPKSLPILETNETAPLSPYGAHKVLAEKMFHDYARMYNLPVSILRVFSAYGNGLRRQIFWDVMNKYVTAIHRGERMIRLFGDGLESRDFVHAADVARAAWIISQVKPVTTQVFNVANGEEVTIRAAIGFLLGNAELKIDLQFEGQTPIGNPRNWLADAGKLRELGYKSLMSLEDGLNEYFRWAIEQVPRERPA